MARVQFPVVLFLLVSGTMHLASFLSRSPNLWVSLGSEISGRARDVLL